MNHFLCLFCFQLFRQAVSATDAIFTRKSELQQWCPITSNTLTAQLFGSHRIITFHQVFPLAAAISPDLTLQIITQMEVLPASVLIPISSQKRQTTYSQSNFMVHQDPVDLQGQKTLVTQVHQWRQFALWYFRSWCHFCWLGSGRCQLGFCLSWSRWGGNCVNGGQVFRWLDFPVILRRKKNKWTGRSFMKRLTAEQLLSIIVWTIDSVVSSILCLVFQNWDVFLEVTEIFILVPAVLGMKGNLEMTLASRLSTAVREYMQTHAPEKNKILCGQRQLKHDEGEEQHTCRINRY